MIQPQMIPCQFDFGLIEISKSAKSIRFTVTQIESGRLWYEGLLCTRGLEGIFPAGDINLGVLRISPKTPLVAYHVEYTVEFGNGTTAVVQSLPFKIVTIWEPSSSEPLETEL